MENNEIPLPEHCEFLGKKYLLRIFYDSNQEQFPCDRLEPRELSALGISTRGMQRAIVYAYFDREKVTRGTLLMRAEFRYADNPRPYWEGGVYSYHEHYESELRKMLRGKKT